MYVLYSLICRSSCSNLLDHCFSKVTRKLGFDFSFYKTVKETSQAGHSSSSVHRNSSRKLLSHTVDNDAIGDIHQNDHESQRKVWFKNTFLAWLKKRTTMFTTIRCYYMDIYKNEFWEQNKYKEV